MHGIRTAKELGAAIRQARTQRGMSQAALAAELGISQPRISDIERGSPGASVGVILKMLSVLEIVVILGRPGQVRGMPPSGVVKKSSPTKDHADLDAIANTGLDAWPTKR